MIYQAKCERMIEMTCKRENMLCAVLIIIVVLFSYPFSAKTEAHLPDTMLIFHQNVGHGVITGITQQKTDPITPAGGIKILEQFLKLHSPARTRTSQVLSLPDLYPLSLQPHLLTKERLASVCSIHAASPAQLQLDATKKRE